MKSSDKEQYVILLCLVAIVLVGLAWFLTMPL